MKIIEVCNLIALHKVHTFSLFQVRGLDVPSKYEHIGLDRSEHGEKGYDLDFHNEEDETVMVAELCSVAALGDVKYLAKLIRLGADPNATDVDNRTPLHLAARNGHIDTMRYLIKQCNVHLNVKDNFGGSPLSDAKKGGSEEAVLFLKDLGAIKVPTEHDEDELRLRAHANEVDQVMALLAGGVDVNSADYDDRTALHIAASEGHEEVVAALLKARADPLVTDRFGMMPIQDAQRYKHEGMERLIRSGTDVDFDRMTTSTISKSTSIDFDGGASTRELLHAAHTGDLAEIKRLKLKRANLLGCDYDGRTALHLAASSGHMHIVKYMVELIPGTNVNQQDRAKNSAYSEAVSNHHVEVAEFLVDHGATELSHPGVGAELCTLAAHGDLVGLKAKVAEGKSLLSADYDGRTALHLAACTGHAEIVDFLVNPGGGKPGIHIDTRDRWGGTALEDAERCDEHAVADKLKALGATTTTHLKTVIGGEALSDVTAVDSILAHGAEPAPGAKSTAV